ncbi:MAG: PHP domain-containing protein [Phycisphaerae bacterium]|nr:PHP domain-containing protein [Phycisphaerae bacterium]
MRRFVDLHTHSTASDGTLAPADLIRQADRAELAVVALTDHDTVAGLDEARRAAEPLDALQFVPGIELSAQPPSGTLHILGLGIDPSAPAILSVAAQLRQARVRRNPQIVQRLRWLGVPVTMDDVRRAALDAGSEAEVISRMHVARALVRAGWVRDTKEAFARYLGKGCPGYVERERPAPHEAITAIHGAGGLAVLAHPVQLGCTERGELERVVRGLSEAGLDAIEAWHSDHDAEWTRLCVDLADRLGLGVVGGSDFHGGAKPGVRLGRPRVSVAALSGSLRRRFGV